MKKTDITLKEIIKGDHVIVRYSGTAGWVRVAVVIEEKKTYFMARTDAGHVWKFNRANGCEHNKELSHRDVSAHVPGKGEIAKVRKWWKQRELLMRILPCIELALRAGKVIKATPKQLGEILELLESDDC